MSEQDMTFAELLARKKASSDLLPDRDKMLGLRKELPKVHDLDDEPNIIKA